MNKGLSKEQIAEISEKFSQQPYLPASEALSESEIKQLEHHFRQSVPDELMSELILVHPNPSENGFNTLIVPKNIAFHYGYGVKRQEVPKIDDYVNRKVTERVDREAEMQQQAAQADREKKRGKLRIALNNIESLDEQIRTLEVQRKEATQSNEKNRLKAQIEESKQKRQKTYDQSQRLEKQVRNGNGKASFFDRHQSLIQELHGNLMDNVEALEIAVSQEYKAPVKKMSLRKKVAIGLGVFVSLLVAYKTIDWGLSEEKMSSVSSPDFFTRDLPKEEVLGVTEPMTTTITIPGRLERKRSISLLPGTRYDRKKNALITGGIEIALAEVPPPYFDAIPDRSRRHAKGGERDELNIDINSRTGKARIIPAHIRSAAAIFRRNPWYTPGNWTFDRTEKEFIAEYMVDGKSVVTTRTPIPEDWKEWKGGSSHFIAVSYRWDNNDPTDDLHEVVQYLTLGPGGYGETSTTARVPREEVKEYLKNFKLYSLYVNTLQQKKFMYPTPIGHIKLEYDQARKTLSVFKENNPHPTPYFIPDLPINAVKDGIPDFAIRYRGQKLQYFDLDRPQKSIYKSDSFPPSIWAFTDSAIEDYLVIMKYASGKKIPIINVH